jgi:hypothetical protein
MSALTRMRRAMLTSTLPAAVIVAASIGLAAASSGRPATTIVQATQPTAPEPPPIGDTLRGLDAILAKLAIPDTKTATLKRAQAAVAELLKLSAKWPPQSPVEYRANLVANLRALEAAAARNWDVLAPTLESLAEDLEAKLDHCKASGGRLGGTILVRVRTLVGGAEAKAWNVKYLPKALELSQTATADRFPQLSSPTEEPLVPGRYVIWAEDSTGTRRGDRVVVRVGDGRKELMVDLPVPPDKRP